jgi:hypothetical protein
MITKTNQANGCIAKLLYLITLLFFTANSLAADNGVFTYNLTSEGAEITGCVSTCPSDLVIPDTIDSLKVFAIGSSAFKNEGLINIIVPRNVTAIGQEAFYGNQLANVSFLGDRPISDNDIFALQAERDESFYQDYHSQFCDDNDPFSTPCDTYSFNFYNVEASLSITYCPAASGWSGEKFFVKQISDSFMICTHSIPGHCSGSIQKHLSTPQINQSCDSDNDGVINTSDAFPFDSSETLDTDLDGIGNNADTDDDNDGVEDGVDQDPLDPNVGALPAQIVSVVGSPLAIVGRTVSVEVSYDVNDGNTSLTGLGLRVHYNSSLLSFDQFADVLSTDNISSAGPFDDEEDLDSDPSTDKYLSVAWASLFGNWPSALPKSLMTVNFIVADSVADIESTTIGFSASSNAAGYGFEGLSYDLPLVSATWDFDRNGTADALTDGLLLLRHTFGLRGATLTDGAIAPDSPLTAAEVELSVESAYSIADIDGDGTVDALTDGLLLLRYLFGLQAESLITGAISSEATRTSVADIESYIQNFIPVDTTEPVVTDPDGTDDVNNNDSNSDQSVDITGTVTFDLVPFNTFTNGLDYNQTQVAPARGVLVETIDPSGNKVDSTVTNSTGYFSLKADANTDLRIRIAAQMMQTEGAQWDVKVTDNTSNNALYVTEGDLFNTATAGGERNFHMASGWDGNSYSQPRAAAPFAILDAIYDSMQKVASVDPDVVFPPVEIHWSENNSVAGGSEENGDIGTSFYREGKIYILGKQDSDTDEYDRHIIVHEWGHYFEDQLSRSESIGGSHGDGERLDMRVAFGEGWGNALSAMVTDDPFYRDSSGYRQSGGWSMDMESNYTINRGWFNETSVQSILYDLYDTDADDDDNLGFGFGPIYSALTHSNYKDNPYFTSIYPFIELIKEHQPASGSAIDQLLAEQQIYGSGNNGIGEINDGGISTVLPIYKTVSLGDGNINVCYVNEAGVKNKLGNHIYVAFDATSTGSYTFSLNSADSYGAFSDPDLRLYRSGIKIAENISVSYDGNTNLSVDISSTGLHIVEVSVWEVFPELGLGNNGTACFNLQITN